LDISKTPTCFIYKNAKHLSSVSCCGIS